MSKIPAILLLYGRKNIQSRFSQFHEAWYGKFMAHVPGFRLLLCQKTFHTKRCLMLNYSDCLNQECFIHQGTTSIQLIIYQNARQYRKMWLLWLLDQVQLFVYLEIRNSLNDLCIRIYFRETYRHVFSAGNRIHCFSDCLYYRDDQKMCLRK